MTDFNDTQLDTMYMIASDGLDTDKSVELRICMYVFFKMYLSEFWVFRKISEGIRNLLLTLRSRINV